MNLERSQRLPTVAIQHSAKKGKIEIEYYGDDDLQRLLELLGLGASECCRAGSPIPLLSPAIVGLDSGIHP
jgi:hypothetical protein